MSTSNLQTATIKEIVTNNFQTAAVFEKYSLDFCCRGGKTIDQACAEKGIPADDVYREVGMLSPTAPADVSRFSEWQPDFLVQYIIANHHAYVRKMIPVLYAHTQKVASVHGQNHPEVIAIARSFEKVALELQQHMQKEEQILFPYINQLCETKRGNASVDRSPFGTVQNPIAMMEREHQSAGDELYEIRSLSNSYDPPQDACTTYRISYRELQEFERDLHQHVHLENNILFPQAILLEQEIIRKN